jgi:hypothetical protein
MPLSHKPLSSTFDEDTQIMLSKIYVELSAAATARLGGHADDARNKIADELIRLTSLGERNPDILKNMAVAAAGYEETNTTSR